MSDRRSWSIAVQLGVPVLSVVTISIAAFGIYTAHTVKKNATEYTVMGAKSMIDQYRIIRGYYARNVISKVKSGSDLAVHYDHLDDGGTIPLPATLIHDLSKLFAEDGQATRLKLYSAYPFPNRKDRVLDDFGRDALRFFEHSPDQTYTRVEVVDGHEMIRVALADKMVDASCVRCHNSHPDTPRKGWQLGDVRGVLEVTTQVDDELASVMGAGMRRASIVLSLLIIALVSGIGMFAMRRVSGRLSEIERMLEDVEEGDLTASVEVVSHDEVGRMATSLNRFTSKLRTDLSQVRSEGQRVREASANLSEVASGLSEGAMRMKEESAGAVTSTRSLDETIQSVAGSIDESSGNVRSVAAAIEETSTNLGAVSENSRGMADELSSVASAVDQMNASISNVAESAKQAATMTKGASDAARDANQTLSNLGTSANEIGKVVDAINDIAEQTNLLALNATIEAASAGEAGRGFAVVANEVKELATQTGRSTEDIRRRVEEMQANTHASARAIEGIVTSIDEIDRVSASIATTVEEQGNAIGEIARLTTSVADTSSLISRNVDEASAGSSEVARSSEELANGVRQIAQAASEASAGAGQVSEGVRSFDGEVQNTMEGASSVDASATELSGLARKLEKLVDQFRL